MSPGTVRRVAIFAPRNGPQPETFIQAHIERLPFDVTPVVGPVRQLGVEDESAGASLAWRIFRKGARRWHDRRVGGRVAAWLRARQIEVVLAEYGPTGVALMDGCARAGVPLVVHFHGFDASEHLVLEQNRASYPALFAAASAVVVVSDAMRDALHGLGCDPAKLHVIPCGADAQVFRPTAPDAARDSTFVAVGRLVDKKSPTTTLRAFACVREQHPDVTLVMVGDGPLMDRCRALVAELGVEDAVTLRSNVSQDVVRELLQRAYVFVQHSVKATNGDCEGTPVSIIEAQLSGLPVVATRHAGIPGVVVDGETGLLVDEHDVEAMAGAMGELWTSAERRRAMGLAGRARALAHFEQGAQIAKLAEVLRGVVS